MRLFITTMMSVMLTVSMVAFVFSFSACDSATEDVQEVAPVEDADVVEDTTEAVEAVEDTVEDAAEEEETTEEETTEDTEDAQREASALSPYSNTELIVFNVDGKVIYSQVISNI